MLTHLKLFSTFRQDTRLPPKLTHLCLHHRVNQPIAVGVLPPTLTHLYLGVDFDQPIPEDVLPVNLTHLDLGPAFNQSIGENVLPQLNTSQSRGTLRPEHPGGLLHTYRIWEINSTKP